MMRTVRKTPFLLVAALLAVAAAQLGSCEKFLLPEVELSQDTLWYSAAGGVQSVHVTTNVITTANPETRDSDWITTDPVWFDASCDVQVTVSENAQEDQRTSSIPIKSEAIIKYLVIIQAGH